MLEKRLFYNYFCVVVAIVAVLALCLPAGARADLAGDGELSRYNRKFEDLTSQEVRDIARKYGREPAGNVEYVESDYKSLSRLYWALGIFDPERDTEAVNRYLMIHECPIYSNYINDDFEWKNIHSATVAHLKQSMDDFPKRFQFTRPVRLGRYDFEKEAFLIDDYQLNKGARKYEVLQSFGDTVCGARGPLRGYPSDLHMMLTTPFQLNYLPMSPEVARDYVARTNHENIERYRDREAAHRREAYDRTVYLRVRVRFVDFQGMARTAHGLNAAKLVAVLEGYDIFEDQDGEKVIFTTREQDAARPGG